MTTAQKNTLEHKELYVPVRSNCEFIYVYRLDEKKSAVEAIKKKEVISDINLCTQFIRSGIDKKGGGAIDEKQITDFIESKGHISLETSPYIFPVILSSCKKYSDYYSTAKSSKQPIDFQDNHSKRQECVKAYEKAATFLGHRRYFGVTPEWDENDFKQYQSCGVDPELNDGRVYTPYGGDTGHKWETVNEPWLISALAQGTRIYVLSELSDNSIKRSNPPEGLDLKKAGACSAFAREVVLAASCCTKLTYDKTKDKTKGRIFMSGCTMDKTAILKQCALFTTSESVRNSFTKVTTKLAELLKSSESVASTSLIDSHSVNSTNSTLAIMSSITASSSSSSQSNTAVSTASSTMTNSAATSTAPNSSTTSVSSSVLSSKGEESLAVTSVTVQPS